MLFVLACLSGAAPITGQCNLYKDCESCSLHYADRNCGWCDEDGKQGCIEYDGNNTQCDASKFYYNGNARCGSEIPVPPQPWERYDANATFCYAMSGEWCEKCVSLNTSMRCGWCHTTRECIMGDEQGPYFLSCPDWSFTADDKCLGTVSKGTAIAIRVTIAVVISIISALSVLGCVVVIRKPKNQEPTYDEVN